LAAGCSFGIRLFYLFYQLILLNKVLTVHIDCKRLSLNFHFLYQCYYMNVFICRLKLSYYAQLRNKCRLSNFFNNNILGQLKDQRTRSLMRKTISLITYQLFLCITIISKLIDINISSPQTNFGVTTCRENPWLCWVKFNLFNSFTIFDCMSL
jgi:hypothetical protein